MSTNSVMGKQMIVYANSLHNWKIKDALSILRESCLEYTI